MSTFWVTFGGTGEFAGRTVTVQAREEWEARQVALRRYGGGVFCRQVGLTDCVR